MLGGGKSERGGKLRCGDGNGGSVEVVSCARSANDFYRWREK
jgi:hypothetical protein